MSTCESQVFGADPVNIKWNVVRGDTATLRVQFYQPDEKTFLNISSWDFIATAYNSRENSFDELEIEIYNGYIDVIATSDITETWGNGIRGRVAELSFDVQAIIDDRTWTPVVGIISVIADVTGGRL